MSTVDMGQPGRASAWCPQCETDVDLGWVRAFDGRADITWNDLDLTRIPPPTRYEVGHVAPQAHTAPVQHVWTTEAIKLYF